MVFNDNDPRVFIFEDGDNTQIVKLSKTDQLIDILRGHMRLMEKIVDIIANAPADGEEG